MYSISFLMSELHKELKMYCLSIAKTVDISGFLLESYKTTRTIKKSEFL